MKKAELGGDRRNEGRKAHNCPRATEALLIKKKKIKKITSQPYTVEQKFLKIQSCV